MVRKKKTKAERDKARKMQYIKYMRKAFCYSELYTTASDSAVSDETGPRGGRLYTCYICGCGVPQGQREVEHEDPVTPFDKFQYEMGDQEVYERLFRYDDPSVLKVACKPCHKEKSKGEMKERRRIKKEMKAEV